MRATHENGATSHTGYKSDDGWEASVPTSPVTVPESEVNGVTSEVDAALAEKRKVKKFRGVPEDVQLFEVFWRQVVELIKVSTSSRVDLLSD